MKPLDRYIHDHSTPEEPLLQALDRETHQRTVAPRMISGHLQGNLLQLLTKMMQPRRVLEIGTFTGYSALSIAAGLEEGSILDTFEPDDELEPMIRSYFDRSPHGSKIRLHIGSVLDAAPELAAEAPFDLVFIDGDKREYPDYYRMLLGDKPFDETGPLVREGSILLADNILWYGKVAEPIARGDRHTEALVAFNRMVADDSRTENVILSLRDGLNLIRIKRL